MRRKPQRKLGRKGDSTPMRKPPLDLRRNTDRDPRSRFHEFEDEELRVMLARLDAEASVTELGLWFEISRDLRFRDPTYEQELPDGVRPAVD